MSPISGLAGFGGGVSSKLLGGGGGGASSFTFDYHMYGATTGNLEVYVFSTTTSSLIGPLPLTYSDGADTGTVISGQQQPSSSAAWENAVVDLTDAIGMTGYLAFKYRPTNSYTADASLDSMALTLSNGTLVDLDPDLFRSDSIVNWQSARFQNKTDNSFPIDGGSVLINSNSYYWIDCPKSSSGTYMGQYEDGITGSQNTGPSADSDGSTVGYYIYFETSSPNNSYTAWLRTKNQYTF